jgi:hypothetical protein
MVLSISQSAAGANRNASTRLTVALIALLSSVLLHGVMIAASALHRAPPIEPPASNGDGPGLAAVETDLVEVDKSTGDAVVRGDEDKAQGVAQGGPAAPAPEPAPTLAKSPPVAPKAERPADARRPPPPAETPPTRDAKTEPAIPDADADATGLPSKPDRHSRASKPEAPRRAEAGPKSGDGESPPPSRGGSGVDPSAPGPDTDGPKGDGGGQKRRGGRDLASALTYELPDCAYYVSGWTSAPLGDGGTLLASIVVDDTGKVTAAEPEPGTKPSEAFSDTLRRVLGRLKVGKLALENGELDGGSLHVRITAKVSDVPAPDHPGGAVAIEHTFDRGHGRASFTLESGRRVEFEIAIVKVEHAS